MWTEALYITGNLGSFSLALFLAFSTQKLRFSEKLLSMAFFGITSFLFYLSFWGKMNSEEGFFDWKNVFFSHKYLIFLILLSGTSIYIRKFQERLSLFLFFSFASPFLYFFFFGMEKFLFWGYTVEPPHFLKSQNPLISCVLFPILFIPHQLIFRIVLPLVFLGFFGFYYLERKNLETDLEMDIIHRKYISHEYFTEGNAILLEETYGVYTFKRKIEIEEPIYKFSLKPIRWLERKERQTVQNLVSQMEFPIVIKEKKIITIYEMSRSFRGETFRVVYDIESGKGKLEGPIF
jgi:hypothetical protein